MFHFLRNGIVILIILELNICTFVASETNFTANSEYFSPPDSDSQLNSSVSSPLIFPIPYVNEIVEYYTKEFGQPCNNYEKCDYRFWLSCRNETCQCQKGDIVYDETRNLCVARINTPCKRKVLLDDEGVLVRPNDVNRLHQISQTVEKNILYDVIECPPHGFCDGQFCRCESGYYTDPDNGICLKQKEIHQECQNDLECKSASIFHCLNSTCLCEDPREYDIKIDKCVVPVSTGNCSVMLSGDDDCPDNSSCLGGSCICNEGYAITSGRKCARGYGETCSVENACSDIFLVCRNKMCDCQFPYHQYYNRKRKACVSLVGGYCSVEEEPYKTVECTENANCTFNEFYNECICHSGYVENARGKCSKSYGMSCRQSEECHRGAQLECINGVCHCPDKLTVYDKRLRMCVGLVGSKCYYNSQQDSESRQGLLSNNHISIYTRRFSRSLTTNRIILHRNNLNRMYTNTHSHNNRDTQATYFNPISSHNTNTLENENTPDGENNSYADVSTICVEGASCIPNNPYNTQTQHQHYGKCVCNSFYVPFENRTCNMD